MARFGLMASRSHRNRISGPSHDSANARIQVNSPPMKIFLAALLAVAVCHAQAPGTVPKPPWVKPAPPKAAPEEDDTTIKVDVKLVNVFVTVTDEHGAPVADLKKGNFQLFEDEHLQKIAIFDKESELP